MERDAFDDESRIRANEREEEFTMNIFVLFFARRFLFIFQSFFSVNLLQN